ncbi:SigE family RNA polymerase sigma factor [Nocardioides acrostichi]|uniref:SigE family RNA polymerase sigma factor n=1 Tax=Nocardioides acrostichi TaxID=2784339 RepID=A0A930UYC5_9ACTN|nr:SigE family RNA polymerase sigma factor [Nocardioides acrostichi]MBF4161320.1 SigE family RNA polymerase sigma factor [Nocardioides acrostichi]
MKRAERDAAFTEFVAAHRRRLRGLAFGLCGDWHAADDLVQTALVKLYTAWPRATREGKELAYTRQILVRSAIDESRRPWRRERTGLPSGDRPAPSEPSVEERDELLTALATLPRMQRAVVLLRHWLDLPVSDVARELGISEGTVKSHSSRGLAALGVTLEPADTA